MASLKSSLRKTANSLSANKLMKNDMLTNVALVILVILTFNYLNTRQYQATIFMYIIAVAGYYMCKSLSCGLLAAIVLTNLLISMNYFKISENLENGSGDRKKNKKKGTTGTKDKKQAITDIPDLTEAVKQLEQFGLKK
jgi:uncharacterized membrane protein YciS (DUF1049 family)